MLKVRVAVEMHSERPTALGARDAFNIRILSATEPYISRPPRVSTFRADPLIIVQPVVVPFEEVRLACAGDPSKVAHQMSIGGGADRAHDTTRMSRLGCKEIMVHD